MSTLLNGSICLSDIPKEAIQVSEKNGKKYLNIDVWVNDKEDNYGNIASINIQQTKEEREAKDKKLFIGNLKERFGNKQPKPTTPSAPTTNSSDLPF